jgi:hypothetical protein
VGGTQLFPETSAVPGTGLSVGSQRNLSNNFIVDGLSANDDAAGLSGMTYGVDAIDQFQVVTSGGQAELGRALGGYVNIVTRSGTNRVTGGVSEYFRDRRLNAPNPLSRSTLPMRQWQSGASVGGPIVRNRTFYFTSVEGRRLDQAGLVTIDPGQAAIVNARLADTGYRGMGVATGLYPNPLDTTSAVGKIDHRFAGGDQLTVRYSLYDAVSRHARGAGALSAPSAAAMLDNRDSGVAVGNVLPLTARTVLESRAQLTFSGLAAEPADLIGPAVTIAGIATFGTSSASPTRRRNRLIQVVNNLSQQIGPHALRIGVDLLHNDVAITFPRASRGSYTFPSLDAFLAGTYSNTGFTQTFGDAVVSVVNPNLSLYVQDEWKATSRLTVNAGLRYDVQTLETIETDRNNLSPRVGLAWSPSDSRRTVVRASAGTFYDRVPLRALANALLSAGNTTDLANLRQIGVTLSPAQAAAPIFPAILPSVVPSVTLANLTTMEHRLQNAHSRQASFEIEHQVGRGTVSAGYEHVRGRQLLASINQNVPECVASGGNNGCRPITAYANNNQYSAAGRSRYDALHLSWVQQPSRWGGARLSYTYARALNDVGEAFFSSPIDPRDMSKDWGRSDNDHRHRVVATGSLRLPQGPATTTWGRVRQGFQVSGMLQYYSAPPFNILSGVTTVQGTPGRPIVGGAFIRRNSGIGTDFFSASVRLSRTFSFGPRVTTEVLAEIFNLTNHRNVIARNTNFGTGAYPDAPLPAFGRVTAVGEPRAAQLGLRMRF